ncbi:DUF3460 family protein [Caenimonas sedimenti]|uniref:DUF3460 family protein n=1 Tax=Caenimonas sedimenti TaxID=2596921 RepID=A0A562ZUP4_9BURK|nr:DUF3460 family protein [Caenimonas sedimenti]TWO72203.1 DUF3460 family protein [Caenimonas sedimenti]
MSKFLRLFRRLDYQSDVTQFIEKLKEEKPELEAQQRAGRAIWWDKNIDRDAQGEWREARVPQKPYVYGDDPRQPR